MLLCRLCLAAEWALHSLNHTPSLVQQRAFSQGAKEHVQGTHSSYDWCGSLKAGG